MQRKVLVLTALGACVWLGACRESVKPPHPAAPVAAPIAAADPSSSATPAPIGHAITIKGRIHADLPELSFTLLADGAPDATGVLHVRAIEIRLGNASGPAQRIEGLATDTPWSATHPTLELLDMNFDGYNDFRLAENRPAGPNLPYLNWLYDPASGRFIENARLNAISSPEFDAKTRELRSQWRDGPNRYGTDIYIFHDGQPVPLRRETRVYQRAGVYSLQTSRWVDGAWRVVETREGRDH